jgi:hypothetical protein
MVFTGKSVTGGGIIAEPMSLAGKRYKSPRRLPMGGSPFMMQIRGFQAAGTAFHYAMMPKFTMQKVYAQIKKVSMKIFRESQRTCPMDTGKLAYSGRFIDKSRIMPRTGGKDQFIDIHIVYGGGPSQVDYAVYVHEGHSTKGGKWVMGDPWLVRAARRYKRSLLRATKNTAMGVWNRFAKQINTASPWVTVGGGANIMGTPAAFGVSSKYGTGAGAGWGRMLSGTGVTVSSGVF